jgi:chromosome segregation ATPase
MPFVSKAVNDLRQELNILSNSTTASISELRKYWSRAGAEVEETRRGIQNSVDNRIAQANKTLHEALEDAVQSLHSSLAKVDAKVNKLQKRTNVLIDEVKDDLSKAKAKFQENDRKHDQAISGAATKMESVQNRVTKLEGERNSDIQTIDELKDERNSDTEKWNWNKQMIVIFVCLGINFLLTLILFKVYCCK